MNRVRIVWLVNSVSKQKFFKVIEPAFDWWQLVMSYEHILPTCYSINENMEYKRVHPKFNLSCCMSRPILINTQALSRTFNV